MPRPGAWPGPSYRAVLGSAAPLRVVTRHPPQPLVDRLADLRPGPWWPDLDRLLDGIERVVPDRAGRPGAQGRS